MNVNKVLLAGRLGADPKTGEGKEGKRWAIVNLAVGTGNDTVWVKLFASGKGAEILGEKKKGDTIFVEGQLKQGKDKEGKQQGCDVQVWTVQGVGPKTDAFPKPLPKEAKEAPQAKDIPVEDIPF